MKVNFGKDQSTVDKIFSDQRTWNKKTLKLLNVEWAQNWDQEIDLAKIREQTIKIGKNV